VSSVQSYQEFGGLAGRVLLAFLAVRIVSRRGLLRVFQVPGLILMPTVLLIATTHDLQMLKWGIFALGLTTIGQFSFWGNYLPRMYPTHLRGTGESFAANVGGRMIGTCAALVTTQLVPSMPGGSPAMQLAYAAAIVGTTVYVAAFALSAFLPEPREENAAAVTGPGNQSQNQTRVLACGGVQLERGRAIERPRIKCAGPLLGRAIGQRGQIVRVHAQRAEFFRQPSGAPQLNQPFRQPLARRRR
jgi:hypothetical protein